MKKHLLMAVVLLAATSAFAQEKITVGIRAGVSSATITGDARNSLNSLVEATDGVVTTRNKTGFFAGASVNIPLGSGISVEPGILYDQKGMELRGGYQFKGIAAVLSPSARAALTLNYLTVPVLVKGSFGGFQVFAGPQVSFLTNADLNVRAGALGFDVYRNRMDASAQFNKTDLGVTGGIGYQFGKGFSISAAYDRGLTRVDADRRMNAFNQAVKVGVGYRF